MLTVVWDVDDVLNDLMYAMVRLCMASGAFQLPDYLCWTDLQSAA